MADDGLLTRIITIHLTTKTNKAMEKQIAHYTIIDKQGKPYSHYYDRVCYSVFDIWQDHQLIAKIAAIHYIPEEQVTLDSIEIVPIQQPD